MVLTAIQGIVLSAVLFSHRKQRSNLYLSLFLFLLSLHTVIISLFNRETLFHSPWVLISFDFLPYLYGPLVWFYFRYWLFKEKMVLRRSFIHFLPGLSEILFYSLFWCIAGKSGLQSAVSLYFQGKPAFYILLFEWGKFVSGVCYTLYIIRVLTQNRKLILKRFKAGHHKRWLLGLIMSFSFCWITVIVVNTIHSVLGFNPHILPLFHTIQSLSFLLFFYVITFFSLRYPVIFDPKDRREQIKEKLNLSDRDIEEFKNSIERLIKEEFYLDETLKLRDLSRTLGLHANVLSCLINEEYCMNFSEFLNSLRVDHFLRLLPNMNPETDGVLTLAYESGFSSKSTFNRVFKNKTGKTPSEFKKSLN